MPVKPISFQDGDLKVVGAGDLDPSVLPSTVVLTDGTTPFVAPQAGVTPVADVDLATLGEVKARIAAHPWQGTVLSVTTSAQPGSPTLGDRYILPVGATGANWAGQDKKVAEWTGAAWTFTAPTAGMVAWVTDSDIIVRYSGALVAWDDISDVITHSQLKTLQGGTTSEYYHLTAAQHTLVTGSHSARNVFAAPTGAPGAFTNRALETGDIQSGIFGGARGGLGADASAAAGYAKWTAGVAAFASTIPWADLTGVPSTSAPSAHATSHQNGGSDELALDASQVTTGLLDLARGGTATSGAGLPAKRFLASPTSATGDATYRYVVPDDVTGASAASQVLQRNGANTANVWAVIDATSLGVVPVAREVQTLFAGYLAGGGALSADLQLSWQGIDVQLDGVALARQPIINLGAGLTATEDVGNTRIDIVSSYMDPIVAIIALG